MNGNILASEERFWGETDSKTIQNAVDYAKKTGANSVTVPRFNPRTGKNVWIIEEAIILPSEMEIVLDNAHLRQEDKMMDNIFRNFLDVATEGHTLSQQSRRIVIRGVGNALLDGGTHNGLTEKTSKLEGMPPASRNCMILFYNIRDFLIEGLELRDHRYWAIHLVHAQRGRLSDLRFMGECHCPNQDAIDLRIGCSNIVIERIVGQTGDDVVAYIGNSDATLKRLTVTENGIQLRPLNPAYQIRSFSNDEIRTLPVTIAGIVIEQRRTRRRG